MKIELSKLYYYVFGGGADIEKRLENVPLQHKQAKSEKIKKEIQDFFCLQLGNSASKYNKLRQIIREQKNSHLEKILYGNDVDDIQGIYQFFVEENDIDKKLEELEDEYGLLQDEKGSISTQLRKNFHACFKMCKFIGDIIERNNESDNSTAFMHAYKMRVIFGYDRDDPSDVFKKIDAYLSKHNYFNIANKPLHDALIYSLPIAVKENIHLSQWQSLIQQYGPKVCRLFNMAPAIEKYLGGRCPNNLNEAVDAAKNTRFKHAKSFPELADLFIEYNLSEKLFERSLKIEQNRKKQDNLPSITIRGSDVSPQYSSYHFVKLPIDDPYAYVLGHATNCCQSIGGESELCVIDGITLENNGFYVLLKKKNADKKEENSNPVLNGKINYQNYEIVGQGYAWLSQNGNLVFDSWENKTPTRDDKIIVDMLKEFSRQVTEQKESTIVRVMIGTGGKTPELFNDNIASHPEVIKEGWQYGDSLKQAIIFCNETLIDSFISRIEMEIKEVIDNIDMKSEDDSFQANSVKNIETLLIFLMKTGMLKKSNIVLTIPYGREIYAALVDIKKSGYEINKAILSGLIDFRDYYPPDVMVKHILRILSILKEAELDKSSICLNSVLPELYNYYLTIAQDIVKVVLLLRECNIEINLEKLIPRRLFENGLISKGRARTLINELLIIKQNHLENNADIVSAIVNSEFSHDRAEEMVVALGVLGSRKMENDYNIRFAVFNHESPRVAVESLILLNEAKLDDPDVRKKVLVSPVSSKGTKEFIRAFTLLRAAGLDQDNDARRAILNDYFFNAECMAKRMVAIDFLIKNKDYEIDSNLRECILASDKSRINWAINPREIDKILDSAFSKRQIIESFINELEQFLEKLPNKTTWGIFPSVNFSKKKKCLQSLKLLQSYDIKEIDNIETTVFCILVKFHGDLIAAKSNRYLTALTSFLIKFNIIIPNTLTLSNDGRSNDNQLFAETMRNFKDTLFSMGQKQSYKALQRMDRP
ncbi:MAG: hypothetical protein ACD_60C00144G0003 [uncultured bacterium]|nr:MAG: hypothetical protein ACD_60C00144G0003 [uncultured bacterium]